MSYATIFEITHQAIPLWIPLSLTAAGLFAIISGLNARKSRFRRNVAWVMLLFLAVDVLLSAYYFIGKNRTLQAYQTGKYKTVEGPVEHFGWQGDRECFTVRGVEFCHDTGNTFGWDPPFGLALSTWPPRLTHQGMSVRVAYSDDALPFEGAPQILRLDVGSNSP